MPTTWVYADGCGAFYQDDREHHGRVSVTSYGRWVAYDRCGHIIGYATRQGEARSIVEKHVREHVRDVRNENEKRGARVGN